MSCSWEQQTVVSLDNGVITGLVSEQGAMGHLLKSCHNIEIDLNTCAVFLHDTNEVFTFSLEYGNIWNKSGLQRKK